MCKILTVLLSYSSNGIFTLDVSHFCNFSVPQPVVHKCQR